MLENISKDIAFAALGLVTALLNAIEIALILRLKKKNSFDKLLISLAVSDALVGITTAVLKIMNIAHEAISITTEVMAKIITISLILSIANLLAITVDRFLAVKFPVKHRIIATGERVNMAILAIWFVSLILATLYMLSSFIWAKDENVMMKVGAITILVFSVVILLAYAAIFYLISNRRIRAAPATKQKKFRVLKQGFLSFWKGPNEMERSILFTGCVVTLSFIICAYPFSFQFLMHPIVNDVSFPSRLMIPLNSFLNPFIYFFKNYYKNYKKRKANVTMKRKNCMGITTQI